MNPQPADPASSVGVLIRDLGLTIAGTPLEPLLVEFHRELVAAGITRVKPRCYLSTEWGVPFGTVAIAMPFYLAHPELRAAHGRRTGLIEGTDPADILRYLRHEMGHVINYAYRLYERADWTARFGSIDQDYEEEYHPQPFSRHYVQHLPGWYAQKHPDEDWAETFAVWMTPGLDWRQEYLGWTGALAKLEYCDRLLNDELNRDPPVTDDTLDEDVGELGFSLESFYEPAVQIADDFGLDLDRTLRSLFPTPAGQSETAAAWELLQRLEPSLATSIFRWTSYFPDRLLRLVRALTRRAELLQLHYRVDETEATLVELTTLLTTFALTSLRRDHSSP